MYEILAETESAALATFWIIDDFTAPCFHHADQDVRIFCAAETFGREHLGIVTTNMFNHFERFSSLDVHEFVFCLLGDFVSEFIDNVAGMSEIFWFYEFFSARIPEVLTNLRFQFRKLVPRL